MEGDVTQLREGRPRGAEDLRESPLDENRRVRLEEPDERGERRGGRGGRWSGRRGCGGRCGGGERATQEADGFQAAAVTVDEGEVLVAEQPMERLGQGHVLEVGGDLAAVAGPPPGLRAPLPAQPGQ